MLCVAIATCSAMPAFFHTPAVFEIVSEQAETVAKHGHSQASTDDVFKAVHGHGSDASDDDHTQALPANAGEPAVTAIVKEGCKTPPSEGRLSQCSRIDRPPRV